MLRACLEVPAIVILQAGFCSFFSLLLRLFEEVLDVWIAVGCFYIADRPVCRMRCICSLQMTRRTLNDLCSISLFHLGHVWYI